MSDIADDIRNSMADLEGPSTDTAPIDVPSRAVPDADDSSAEQELVPTSGDRDASGRYTPRTPAAVPAQPLTQGLDAPNAPAGTPTPQPPAARAPVSWKPEAREDWAKLPPGAQQEVMRREREITETLRTTADARHLQQQFQQVAQPYMHFIQAENSTPMQAFSNMMQTAATLRVGSAQQKADLVTNICMQHGIDLQMLDAALSARMGQGGQQQPQHSDVMQLVDQRLAPLMQHFNGIQQQRAQVEQQSTAALQSEVDAFMSNPANEFAGDVHADMADILDLAANRGQKITLQDAYNRATMLHPTISGIVQRRQQNGAVASTSQAALRAKRAAASISDNGAPSRDSSGEDSDDIRSAITASMRSLNRRA